MTHISHVHRPRYRFHISYCFRVIEDGIIPKNFWSGTYPDCLHQLSQNKDSERSQGVEPDAVKVASPVLNEGDVGNVPKGNAPSCPYPVSAKSVGCSMRASSTVILS